MYKPTKLMKILTFLRKYNLNFVEQNIRPNMG